MNFDFIDDLQKLFPPSVYMYFPLHIAYLDICCSIELILLKHILLLEFWKFDSPDLHCVSTYYSSKYASKIFAVLDIIPVSSFFVVLDSETQPLFIVG